MKNLKRNESGFTIIEVVLVLAIAGLIFLVVFLALPQLQRSQRDSQRRSDAGRLLTALETYASNNNGTYPPASEVDDFVDAYLTNDDAVFQDPSGNDYDVTRTTGNPNLGDVDPDGTVYYGFGRQCAGTEGDFEDGGGNRKVAVMFPLENGIAYCQDNR